MYISYLGEPFVLGAEQTTAHHSDYHRGGYVTTRRAPPSSSFLHASYDYTAPTSSLGREPDTTPTSTRISFALLHSMSLPPSYSTFKLYRSFERSPCVGPLNHNGFERLKWSLLDGLGLEEIVRNAPTAPCSEAPPAPSPPVIMVKPYSHEESSPEIWDSRFSFISIVTEPSHNTPTQAQALQASPCLSVVL
ncbi:hypothetical protein FIBSPDRAFT_939487 [Athelia psychrophila]|uniref:Uncharacterized protein n=1 Tax=Athelia psychrophila TaxID=1759441 RepID=A0A167XRK4_9AGAM|nr:hypothetical protein FIBSPDRAFT_939487 [Fibularhizoctonia sp. CBS 109695]